MDLFTALFTLNVFLDIVGMFLFGIVIRTVIKHKELHGTCHLLIGVFALCGFCSKSTTILPYISSMTKLASWEFFAPICIVFFMLPLSVMQGYFPMLLAISFDRLLCVCCPIWYKLKANKKGYLLLLLFLSSFYPLFFVYKLVECVVKNSLTLCFVNDDLYRIPLTLRIKGVYLLLILTCYLINLAKHIYVCKIIKIQSGSFLQQLYKSLALLVFIEIARFFVIYFAYPWVGQLENLVEETRRIFIKLLDCLVSVLTSSEVPVLLFTSSEYRKALRKDFAWILRHSSSNNSVVVVGTSKPNMAVNTEY